jgi:hypothetical protein
LFVPIFCMSWHDCAIFMSWSSCYLVPKNRTYDIVFKGLGLHCFRSFTSCLAPLKKIYYICYSVSSEKWRCVFKCLEGLDHHIKSIKNLFVRQLSTSIFLYRLSVEWWKTWKMENKYIMLLFYLLHRSRSWLEFKDIRKLIK